jgi:uncharacterized protein (DUF305 family)
MSEIDELERSTMSDVAAERLLRGVLVLVGLAALAAAFIGAASWALAADDEEPPLGAVDVGYLQDMIDHHGQALLISETYLADQPEGPAAPYAREVIQYQERDIARMEAMLDGIGFDRGVPDRMAMVWMGEPYPVGEMPGMQSRERIDELDAATGAEADLLFFDLMTDHHIGGVHMAEYAADFAENETVAQLAADTAYNQAIEVVEYDTSRQRLGIPPR